MRAIAQRRDIQIKGERLFSLGQHFGSIQAVDHTSDRRLHAAGNDLDGAVFAECLADFQVGEGHRGRQRRNFDVLGQHGFRAVGIADEDFNRVGSRLERSRINGESRLGAVGRARQNNAVQPGDDGADAALSASRDHADFDRVSVGLGRFGRQDDGAFRRQCRDGERSLDVRGDATRVSDLGRQGAFPRGEPVRIEQDGKRPKHVGVGQFAVDQEVGLDRYGLSGDID